jgi:hypothetical protein
LIDGEAVAETLNAFGLQGANGGDLRQRRYPDRYAGVASASPHRSPGTAAGHFGEHLGPTDDQIAWRTLHGVHAGEPRDDHYPATLGILSLFVSRIFSEQFS